jgi:hypothetical protein
MYWKEKSRKLAAWTSLSVSHHNHFTAAAAAAAAASYSERE